VLVLLLPAFGFGVLPGPELLGLGVVPTSVDDFVPMPLLDDPLL